MKERRITLKTIACLGEGSHSVIDRLEDLGIVFADQILRLRVYDLLNMNRIDAEAARETIYMLYRIFNPNTLIDEGLEDMTVDQQFPFAIWRKKYPDLSVVTVRNLVMAPGINKRAIDRIYNRIIKAFFKSEEYNSREYRYLDYNDYLIHRR